MNAEKTKSAPTLRFSERARYYNRYRPGYPSGVMELMKEKCGLKPSWVVADIGSGTGILTEMLLKNGNAVFAVEPNIEMRKIAEELLKGYPNFKSVDGTAESTTLGDDSVHMITVGHAFHWFKVKESRAEFSRIIKRGGWVVLIWNNRRTDSTPFLRAYEDLLLRFGTDYREVNPTNFDDRVLTYFFGKGGFRVEVFNNTQVFDLEGLKGRLLSSSYVPMEGHPNYEEMIKELERIFHLHQSDGRVVFEYDTRVYYGGIR